MRSVRGVEENSLQNTTVAPMAMMMMFLIHPIPVIIAVYGMMVGDAGGFGEGSIWCKFQRAAPDDRKLR